MNDFQAKSSMETLLVNLKKRRPSSPLGTHEKKLRPLTSNISDLSESINELSLANESENNTKIDAEDLNRIFEHIWHGVSLRQLFELFDAGEKLGYYTHHMSCFWSLWMCPPFHQSNEFLWYTFLLFGCLHQFLEQNNNRIHTN